MDRESAIPIHAAGDDSPPVAEPYSHNYGIKDFALDGDDMSACTRFFSSVICATPEFKALIQKEYFPYGVLHALHAHPDLDRVYMLLTSGCFDELTLGSDHFSWDTVQRLLDFFRDRELHGTAQDHWRCILVPLEAFVRLLRNITMFRSSPETRFWPDADASPFVHGGREADLLVHMVRRAAVICPHAFWFVYWQFALGARYHTNATYIDLTANAWGLMRVLDERVLRHLLYSTDNPTVLQAFRECGGGQGVPLGSGPARDAVRRWLPSQSAL